MTGTRGLIWRAILAQYFGFFSLSGKATSFMGTFLFGAIVAATGSSRMAIFGLLPLFAFGALLLWNVRQPTGQQRKQIGT